LIEEDAMNPHTWKSFLPTTTCIIANNFNHVFSGVRGGAVMEPNHISLDTCLASMFALMKPGSRLCTLHPLLFLGNDAISKNGKMLPHEDGFDALKTFFTYERKFVLPRLQYFEQI